MDHITPLLMAAQSQCTDAFQSLMKYMDQPFEEIFKIMNLMVDHTRILTVSFGKLYSYFMEIGRHVCNLQIDLSDGRVMYNFTHIKRSVHVSFCFLEETLGLVVII